MNIVFNAKICDIEYSSFYLYKKLLEKQNMKHELVEIQTPPHDICILNENIIFDIKNKLSMYENNIIYALDYHSYEILCLVKKSFDLNFDIKQVFELLNLNITQSFNGFNASIYAKEDKKIQNLIQKTKLKCLKFDKINLPNGFGHLNIDKNFALQIISDIKEEAFDNSSDFIIVDDIRDFYMLENLSFEIEKSLKRELKIPTLTLAEFLLLAIKSKLDFKNHLIIPSFI